MRQTSNQALTKDESVSSESEELILVNAADEELGFLDKAACHDGAGTLHRAFSLFIFNDKGELLIQQRQASKRLWPLYWSNTCCSHPRRGESMDQAVHRRLEQELGMHAALEFAFKFEYNAQFESEGSEHELCWVYLGQSDDAPVANTTEINAWRWIAPDALDAEMQAAPDQFTPWLKMEWQRLRAEFPDRLRA